MTKKEIKETVKKFQKVIEEKENDLKVLDILKPTLPSHESVFHSQEYIQKNVNLYTKDKTFSFSLKNGPYKTRYTQNSSNMLAFNNCGYISSFNAQNFNLNFEMDLEDLIYDAKYLHNELLMAVAQKESVYIYDNTGKELHAVRDMKNTRMLEFLPYHFLLAGTTSSGFMNYFDTSIGEMVSTLFVGDKEPIVIKNNPSNAVIHLGSKNGRVSLWSPSQKSYLMKVNCHKSAISTLEIDRSGQFMITSGMDNKLKVFDIRNTYTPLKTIQTKANIHVSSISQRNLVAISYSNKVMVLKNFDQIYQKYNAPGVVSSLEFCSYEDVLSIGHLNGICSIVVPGSGDPIYDSKELSPFMSTKDRQNSEVRRLLDKIPTDLISIKPIFGEFEQSSKSSMPDGRKRYFQNDEKPKDALSRFYKRN